MKILIVSTLFLAILDLSAQEIINIKMRSLSKPIIKAEINGKKGLFLVDTGSSISIINASSLNYYHLKEVGANEQHRKAVGFSGNRAFIKRIKNVRVILEGEFDHTEFYSIKLDPIVESIEMETNLRITGIIGTDLLRKYDGIINYKKRNITLINNKIKKNFIKKAY